MGRLAAALLLGTACASHAAGVDPRLEAQFESARAARAADAAQAGPVAVFVGAAMDGSSSAFVGDVQLAELQLRHWAPRLSVLRLANGRPRPVDWAPVDADSMRQSLALASRLLPGGAPARAVVLLSSHGSKGLLSMARDENDDAVADARQLVAWLKPLGDTPTLLIISACYSGSLIPSLKQANRIIVVAASPTRASFGCDVESSNTYFIEELFGAAFDASLPMTDWFEHARRGVARRERDMGLAPPSNPLVWIADAMRPMAAQTLAGWLRADPARP